MKGWFSTQFHHSRTLWFMEGILIECSPGISGDMLLGAFYDLGVPKKVIEKPLIDLGLKDISTRLSGIKKLFNPRHQDKGRECWL